MNIRAYLAPGRPLLSGGARDFDAYVFAVIGPALWEDEPYPGEVCRKQADILMSQGQARFSLRRPCPPTREFPSWRGIYKEGRGFVPQRQAEKALA